MFQIVSIYPTCMMNDVYDSTLSLRVLKEFFFAEVFVIVFVPFVHDSDELHSTHVYIYIYATE